MTKSQAKYCAFLSAAGVSKVCRLLRAIVTSSPIALKRARMALKRRVHLGWALGSVGGGASVYLAVNSARVAVEGSRGRTLWLI